MLKLIEKIFKNKNFTTEKIKSSNMIDNVYNKKIIKLSEHNHLLSVSNNDFFFNLIKENYVIFDKEEHIVFVLDLLVNEINKDLKQYGRIEKTYYNTLKQIFSYNHNNLIEQISNKDNLPKYIDYFNNILIDMLKKNITKFNNNISDAKNDIDLSLIYIEMICYICKKNNTLNSLNLNFIPNVVPNIERVILYSVDGYANIFKERLNNLKEILKDNSIEKIEKAVIIKENLDNIEEKINKKPLEIIDFNYFEKNEEIKKKVDVLIEKINILNLNEAELKEINDFLLATKNYVITNIEFSKNNDKDYYKNILSDTLDKINEKLENKIQDYLEELKSTFEIKKKSYLKM